MKCLGLTGHFFNLKNRFKLCIPVNTTPSKK